MNQYEKANLWERREVEDGSRQKQLEQSTSERGQRFQETLRNAEQQLNVHLKKKQKKTLIQSYTMSNTRKIKY